MSEKKDISKTERGTRTFNVLVRGITLQGVVITLCFIAYFFAAFYDGELPIKNIEEFKGWIVTVGVLASLFL